MSMDETQVMVKAPADNRILQVNFSDVLTGAETLQGGSVQVTPSGLTVTPSAPNGPTVILTIGGGDDLQSYKVDVTFSTDEGHILTKTIAVVNNSNLAIDYQTKNVDALNDLLGELEAGAAGTGSVSFMFPLPFSSANGNIRWDLIDRDGVVYSSGMAHSYDVVTLSNDVKITGSAVINAPSEMVPTLEGQNYQVRWTLSVNGQKHYSSETLKVTGPETTPEGVEDVVELYGNDIPVRVMVDLPYQHVTFEVYKENDLIIPATNVPSGVKTPNGWMYGGSIQQPLMLVAALEAYTIIWSAWNDGQDAFKMRQTGRVFVVNPSILSAVEDVKLVINKSSTSIGGSPDLLFTTPLLLAYLRRGRDGFNGAGGVLTGFTMLNATGSIRDFWLRYTEVLALNAQYLAEGEKVFSFSGQAISLDVDRTQFYESLASKLQGTIDSEVKPYKQNLVIKGATGGDGNLGASGGAAARPGAGGAVGITISPATGWMSTRGFNRFGGLR